MNNKKKAGIVKSLWERANGAARRKWQSVAQRSHEFYLNEQLTAEEMKNLEESGMPTFIINRITPVVEMMKFFVTSNSPRWQAVGTEGSDIDIAAVHSDIAAYCWSLSGGKSLFANIIQDSLTKGVGYFFVDVEPDMDRGMGEVILKRVDPFDVYVDPMSRDQLFRDASYIIIKKNLPKRHLEEMFPDHKRKIKKATGSNDSSSGMFSERDLGQSEIIDPINIGDEAYDPTTGDQEEVIDLYEQYSKEKLPYYNVVIKLPVTEKRAKTAKELVDAKIQEYSAEKQVEVKEGVQKIQMALESGEIIEERAQLEMEKMQQAVSDDIESYAQELYANLDEHLSKTETIVMSEKEYLLTKASSQMGPSIVDAVRFYDTRIKVCCVIGDTLLYEYYLANTEYPLVPICYTYTGSPYPMSAVTPLVGKQQEINKAHQIMLHNANLSSNLRWAYQEGSIDEEEWEKYSSAPGALLKYRQGFESPTPIQPMAINNAFYTITQQGKSDIEYMSGIYSAMQGDTSSQHETYRGMLAVDEHGTRRIKAWLQTMIEPSLEHLGSVFAETAQDTYQAQKVFRIVQPQADDSNEESSSRINVPLYNDFGDVIGKWNDYASSKFDVRYVGGSTMPVNRWALIEEYFKWFQAGLIDDIAMLGETDIRNKEEIVERKSLYAQLQQQVEQMKEELDMKDANVQTLQRQLVQAGIKGRVSAAEADIRKDVYETKAQQKLLRNQRKDNSKKNE